MLRRVRRAINRALHRWGFPPLAVALALSACAAPCSTADLDAKYAVDLVTKCRALNVPLSECPEHAELAEEYERAVTERLGECDK